MPIYRGVPLTIVHNGTAALFWKDVWIGDVLANTHPRAFSFARLEDISMRDFLRSTSLGESFHLPLSAQALDAPRALQPQTLQIDLMDPNSANDEWNCVWGSEYSTNRFYTFYFKDVQVHRTYKWIWKS